MSDSLTLDKVLDDAALLSFEHQVHLADTLGDHSWEADLAEQHFGFTGANPRTCTRFHLLGSAAPGPRSWLWGWANPAGYPAPLLGLTERVRDFGRQHGIAALAEPEVPFDSLPGSPTEPAHVAAMLTDAAKIVGGSWTSYSGEVGGGTRAAFLVEHPDFALPAPEPARVMRILQQSLTDLRLTDHRRAFGSYATRRGLRTAFSPDGGELTLTGPGMSATVRFDQLGRVADISASLGAGRPS